MKLLRVSNLHPTLRLIFKLAITGLAGFIVLSKIDLHQTGKWLQSIPLWSVCLALVFYNLSQFVSTARLAVFFRAEQISLTFRNNLRLYYKGMFYNLFLPGGIGGDGYKIYLLNQRQKVPLKIGVRALIADRANGAVALLALSLALTPFALTYPLHNTKIIGLLGCGLTILSSWIIIVFLFPTLRSGWPKGLLYSFAVQLIQVNAATALFIAFDVPITELTAYVTVFLVSSLASAIPFTIGGIGARELVFVAAADYTTINPDKAVAFALLFFLINALSSLPGGVISSSAK